MGDALREERHDIYQRELLLDTVLQGAPMGIVLTGPTGRVAYANRSARHLLAAGRRLEGQALADVLDACPREIRDTLTQPGGRAVHRARGRRGRDLPRGAAHVPAQHAAATSCTWSSA